MMTASTLIDAYLDINALLIFVCLLWFVFRGALSLAGLSHAVTAQLIVLRAAFVAVLVGPAIGAVALMAGESGMLAPQSVNLTDFILSQYLQGRFEMSPTALENLLTMRARLYSGSLEMTGQVIAGLFAAGMLLAMAQLGTGLVRLRRIIRDSYVWRRLGNIELRVSDSVAVPFSTRGLRRRFIVLPSKMLANAGDLKMALGHELQHFRQGDVEWAIATSLIRPLFFWNPAFHVWARQVEQVREMSCDRQVLARRHFDVAAYCDCLIRVCRDGITHRRLLAAEPPVVALLRPERLLRKGRSALLRRLASAIDGRRETNPRLLSVLVAMPMLAMTLTAAIAIQKPADWSQDRIMLATIINLARLEAINSNAPSFGTLGY